MIQTAQLGYYYQPQRPFTFPDLQCAAGEALLVTGPSGCGKTTLLHLLAGILRPKSGSVIIGDTRLESLSDARLDAFRGKHIGLIYQKSHFLAALSVYDNLRMAAHLTGQTLDDKAVKDVAERLDIAHLLTSLPARLSVGEQQRASIARALVNRPDVVLADEPTSALDDQNCQAVIDLLTRQARDLGAALIVVTHDGRLRQSIRQEIGLSRLDASTTV